MISCVLLTHNEEKNIIDCIESVLFCDEIVIVDDYSIDRTVELVENLKNDKVRIYKRHLENDFSSQRNFGLEKATYDWVLFIDSDERVSKALGREIQLVNTRKSDGFLLRRRDVFNGRELNHGEVGSVKLVRLARKGSGLWRGKVHEEWQVTGKISTLTNPLFHYPHQTVREFLKEIDFYSTVRAQELFEKKVKARAINIILYPKAKFFLNYIVKQGFKDGIEGLVYGLMMSFHSFLVRAKSYLLTRKNE